MSQNTPAVTTATPSVRASSPNNSPKPLDPATVKLDVAQFGAVMDGFGPQGIGDGQVSMQEYLGWKAARLSLGTPQSNDFVQNSTNQAAFKNAEKREGSDRNSTMNYVSNLTLANNMDSAQQIFNRVAGSDGAITREELKNARTSTNPDIAGFSKLMRDLHVSGADQNHTMFGTKGAPKSATFADVMKLVSQQSQTPQSPAMETFAKQAATNGVVYRFEREGVGANTSGISKTDLESWAKNGSSFEQKVANQLLQTRAFENGATKNVADALALLKTSTPPATTPPATPPTTTPAPAEPVFDTRPSNGQIDPAKTRLELDKMRDPKNGYDAATGKITIDDGEGFAKNYPSLFLATSKLITTGTALKDMGLTPQSNNKLTVDLNAFEKALQKGNLISTPTTGQVDPVAINREFVKLRDPANGYNATNGNITIDDGPGFAAKYPNLYFAVTKLLTSGVKPDGMGLTPQSNDKLSINLNGLEQALKNIGVSILPVSNSSTPTATSTPSAPAVQTPSKQFDATALNNELKALQTSSGYNSETGKVSVAENSFNDLYPNLFKAISGMLSSGGSMSALGMTSSGGQLSINFESFAQALHNLMSQ